MLELRPNRLRFLVRTNATGEQYRFVLPGSTLHRAEWEAVLDKLTTLPQKPRFVVASGSVPPGVPEDFFARTARYAKQLGAQCVIDTSGPALQAALREGVALIKPNLAELSDLVGAPLDSESAQLGGVPQVDVRRERASCCTDARRSGLPPGHC